MSRQWYNEWDIHPQLYLLDYFSVSDTLTSIKKGDCLWAETTSLGGKLRYTNDLSLRHPYVSSFCESYNKSPVWMYINRVILRLSHEKGCEGERSTSGSAIVSGPRQHIWKRSVSQKHPTRHTLLLQLYESALCESCTNTKMLVCDWVNRTRVISRFAASTSLGATCML